MNDTMDLKKLAAPFRESEYEWRIAQSGEGGQSGVWAKVVCYVTARAIMDRLDDVVGPENWKVSYTHEPGGVMAHLSIRCGEEWVTKSDGAENTEIESFKGGISGALKRAGVVWGVGRLLYNLPEHWALCSTDKKKFANWAKTKKGMEFSWAPPSLLREASWAVAGGETEPPPAASGNGERPPRRERELDLDGDTAALAGREAKAIEEDRAFPGSDVEDIGPLQKQYQVLALDLHRYGIDVRERGYQIGDSKRLPSEELEKRIKEMMFWLREVG